MHTTEDTVGGRNRPRFEVLSPAAIGRIQGEARNVQHHRCMGMNRRGGQLRASGA